MEHPKDRKIRLEKEEAARKEWKKKYNRFKLGILSEINNAGLNSVLYKLGFLEDNPKARINSELSREESIECIKDAIDHYKNKL